MAFPDLLFCLIFSLLATLIFTTTADEASNETYIVDPLPCSKGINTCNASLYHENTGLQKEQIASYYSVPQSNINPIRRGNEEDYLITVTCSCKDINGTKGYFYDAFYEVQKGDTLLGVSDRIYSGQTWTNESFEVGNTVSMHLMCGCVERDSQIMVTYTVQRGDTLSDIATLLSAEVSAIESMNRNLSTNPGFIDVGWVLFVPKEKNGIPKKGELGLLFFRNIGF